MFHQSNMPMHSQPTHVLHPNCMPMPKLAHAYVPFQQLKTIYPPMEGLDKGTIFPELYDPYCPKRNHSGNEMEVL